MKKPIVIANWKMYIEKPEVAKKFITTLKRHSALLSKVEVTIAPPFTLIPILSTLVTSTKGITLAAQSVSAYTEPKHTGEVSASMLRGCGVQTVIVGHSERRAAGESEVVIAAQLQASYKAQMNVVVCVGEIERDTHGSHFSLIEKQLSVVAGHVKGKLIIAYEPVWAIGKSAGDAMKSSDIQEMVIFIRKTLVDILGREAALKVPIIYGGSVEGSNAHELLKEGGAGGFLVGHASSEINSFIEILQACL